MTSAWAPYLPDYIGSELDAYARKEALGRLRRAEAVTLFADVSGFTPMSEALSGAGRRGAEELNAVLNGYFEPMIDLIAGYGGVVTKFAGDAMMVLFPHAPRSRAATARRAIRCALDMQAAMGRYKSIPTSAGEFTLTMKAGLGRGTVLSTVVGHPELRLEYVLAGPGIDACVAAEGWAEPGDVVVAEELLLPLESVDSSPAGEGFSRVRRFDGRVARRLSRPPSPLSAVEEELLGRFLHPAIAERVAGGHVGFVNEHRRITVLFVSFPDLDYDDPDGAGLQRHFSRVIQVLDRYEAYLRQIDVGDKGSKYIVVLGAPVAHEDDVERALRCGLELRDLADEPIRIGMCTGLAYCGRMGSRTRQEYGVMGDTVNTAARLMGAAAPGQILVAERTRSGASAPFAWAELPPVKLKGKKEPLAVASLEGVRDGAEPQFQEPRYGLPMIGRAEELRTAAECIDAAEGRHGGILAISGEAGIGKSRLSAEVVRLARTRGFRVLGGACRPYAAASAYQVWRPIWRALFGLERRWEPAAQIERLESELAAVDPAYVRRLPLLAPLLALPIRDNELTASLDLELRAELLRSLLLDCLRHHAAEHRLLFVLEDCHWIDEPSLQLLELLARNLAGLPVLVAVLYRSPAEKDPVTALSGLPNFAAAPLEELAAEEAREIVVAKLAQLYGEGRAPSESLVERILEQAAGNPLYIEELLNLLHARRLAPDDEPGAASLELPDSLNSLILARIDQVPEAEKTTLRVASVAGRLFPARWVWGSYPATGTQEIVERHLETLAGLELTPRYALEPELQYVFKHAITHEVAYESLTFAMREELHEAVGRFVERTYESDLTPYLDALAHHFGRSQNGDKQRKYFRLAGDAARNAYANEAAVDYYERLVPLLPPAEQGDVLRDLGEVLQLVGQWADAEETYTEALRLADARRDGAARAEAETSLGSLYLHAKSYDDALARLEQARADFETLGDDVGLGRVLDHLGSTYFWRRDYGNAIACAKRQLDLSEALGDLAGISAASNTLGRVYWHQGDYARAERHLTRALDAAVDAGHRQRGIHAANDIAGLYAEQGDYGRALAHVQQALAGATEIGYRLLIAGTVGNAGELYRRHGDYSRALACYAHAVGMAAEIRVRGIVLMSTVGNAAIACTAQGLHREADSLYERAVSLARMLDSPYYLAAYVHYWADLRTRQGRYDEAAAMNDEALEIATTGGHREIQYLAEILAVRLRPALSQTGEDDATAELEAMLARWPADAEQAGIRYEIWRLDPGRDDARERAADIYRELLPRTPDAEFRRRYEELTGETLPPPPPLPTLPQIEGKPEPDLDELLALVDELAADLVQPA